jgi:hypothetical protein
MLAKHMSALCREARRPSPGALRLTGPAHAGSRVPDGARAVDHVA